MLWRVLLALCVLVGLAEAQPAPPSWRPPSGCTSGQAIVFNGSIWTCGSGGITNSAGANVIPKSDGTNLVASQCTDNGATFACTGAITEGGVAVLSGVITADTLPRGSGGNLVDSAITDSIVGGERVISTSNGVRWDILGPFAPTVDTGLQVVMTGNNHAAEAVAIVGYVTSMDFDLTSGSQHAIGGQFKADATISTPNGTEVLENIAVQGEASGGTRNYSWYSNTGVMRQKGDVQLAVDDSTPRYVVIGPVGGSLPSGGNMQVNLNLTVDPLKTVSLGNNVAPFFVAGSTSVNPKISLGSPTSEGMQVSIKNTVTSGSDVGVGVHVDTTVIGSARGGLRIYRGAGGSTHAGGFEIAGGTNSLIAGSVANDILVYARQAGARVLIGTGATPTARVSVDDSGNVGVGLAAGVTAASRLHIVGSGGASGLTPTTGTIATIENTGANSYLSFLNNTGESGLVFGNSTSATDGSIRFTTGRAIQFRTANTSRFALDANGTLHAGDSSFTSIGNNVHVFDLGNSGTGQTASTSLINATHTGSFSTAGGNITYYGGNIAVSATESAGTGTLTGVALRLSATNGDDPIGLLVDDGRVQFDGNFTANGTANTIGDANTDTLTINAKINSKVYYTGTAPTLSSCGTSPTITGNDERFTITMGTGGATSCTVTFASAFTNAPVCSVTSGTSGGGVSRRLHLDAVSSSAITIMADGTLDGVPIYGRCDGVL